jgi:predicted ABC-type ATPase
VDFGLGFWRDFSSFFEPCGGLLGPQPFLIEQMFVILIILWCMKNKNVYVIAGPNGSGKTTFAKKFLPYYAKCQNFVNADFIAQGISPFNPGLAAVKAGRIVLQQIHELTYKNLDFAFETTLAGKSYLSFLHKLKRRNYFIHLFFLWIPDTNLALARIKERVADGGHNVPLADVRRWFYRSIFNFFELYRPMLDTWMLFDNSQTIPGLIAQEKNKKLSINNKELFSKIISISKSKYE